MNLSNNFAKFKRTILATNTIDIPKSISTTATIINEVYDEIDCAMKYINNFAIADPTLTKGKLSYDDKLYKKQQLLLIRGIQLSLMVYL